MSSIDLRADAASSCGTPRCVPVDEEAPPTVLEVVEETPGRDPPLT